MPTITAAKMPRQFDWIKIYLGVQVKDEADLANLLAYYTDRNDSFRRTPLPDNFLG